jgi:hypothetical protein
MLTTVAVPALKFEGGRLQMTALTERTVTLSFISITQSSYMNLLLFHFYSLPISRIRVQLLHTF